MNCPIKWLLVFKQGEQKECIAASVAIQKEFFNQSRTNLYLECFIAKDFIGQQAQVRLALLKDFPSIPEILIHTGMDR